MYIEYLSYKMHSLIRYNSYFMEHNIINYIIILILFILTIILYYIYKIYKLQIEIYRAINIDLQDKIRLKEEADKKKEEADKLRIEMIEKSRAKVNELYKHWCSKDIQYCLKQNIERTHYFKYVLLKKILLNREETGYDGSIHLLEDCMRD